MKKNLLLLTDNLNENQYNILKTKYEITIFSATLEYIKRYENIYVIPILTSGGLDGDGVGDSLKKKEFITSIDEYLKDKNEIYLIIDCNNCSHLERIGTIVNLKCIKMKIVCHNFISKAFNFIGKKRKLKSNKILNQIFRINNDCVVYDSNNIINKIDQKTPLLDCQYIIIQILIKRIEDKFSNIEFIVKESIDDILYSK